MTVGHENSYFTQGCRKHTQHWGRGYPAELSGPLLHFGFEVLGLHRMYAHCLAENTAAVYWAEKLGMRQEGRLREWDNPEPAST